MLRRFIVIILFFGFVLSLAAGVFAFWGYHYITRDLPKLFGIEDYRPTAVSEVYSRNGKLIGEFFQERRYPAKISEVPLVVRNAFLAAEDASFYSHPGIDIWSIFRAFVSNLQQGEVRQGGSTITQQVVKNLLLTPEKKVERKVKEAILSYRLEKVLSKDDILEIYLNEIFFGNTAYGIKAAARIYFRKEIADLTLAEAAILAGLPKAPSRFSPISNPKRARERQEYVLRQMVKAGFIGELEAKKALAEQVKVYPASAQNYFDAPYFLAEVRRILTDGRKEYNIDRDGLKIYTTVDLEADKMAQSALREGLREVDKRRGWRGPLHSFGTSDKDAFIKRFSPPARADVREGQVYPALVSSINQAAGTARIELRDFYAEIDLRESVWARRRLGEDDHISSVKPEQVLRAGDVIEVAATLKESESPANGKAAAESLITFALDQTPELEGAVVLIDPFSGEVFAAVGGYSYERSQFNRVTQSLRQPGSAFKPVVYLAAVDGFHYTPSTIVYDSPRTFRVGDQFWTPANFDAKFLGGITLRVALEKSRNLVSADIVSRIGVDPIIQYAKRLGIETRMGRNLSLALGSSEVTPLELTRAYGVFAAKGVLVDSVFIRRIEDRDGKVLFDSDAGKVSRARQAISEQSAFIMANMMKGVVEHGTAYRVRELKRPAAGKTGTSNDEMDAWFVGFTPRWVCGVWVGFDLKKSIGSKETGGRVAAPIWLNFMRDYLNYLDHSSYEQLIEESKAEAQRLGIEFTPPEPLEPLDFVPPEGVDPYWVYKSSGLLAEPGASGAILEYFLSGTQPSSSSGYEESVQSYLNSPDL